MKIAIIGGTGNMGYGLALRLAGADHSVTIGSREEQKAAAAAARACERIGTNRLSGLENSSAAKEAEIVIIAVPAAGHRATIESLYPVIKDKCVLDITVPIAFKPLRYAPPEAGSNALETSQILGEGCRVAAGFHTISASLLEDVDTPLAVDTLIAGNDAEFKSTVLALAEGIGLHAYDVGSLMMSPIIESLTPMLIGMNKRYNSKQIGIRIEGV